MCGSVLMNNGRVQKKVILRVIAKKIICHSFLTCASGLFLEYYAVCKSQLCSSFFYRVLCKQLNFEISNCLDVILKRYHLSPSLFSLKNSPRTDENQI